MASPLSENGDLSCEIARTYARVTSLTTGTFNLVVKDRIAFPPERRVFRSKQHCTEAQTASPRNL